RAILFPSCARESLDVALLLLRLAQTQPEKKLARHRTNALISVYLGEATDRSPISWRLYFRYPVPAKIAHKVLSPPHALSSGLHDKDRKADIH
ncbi:MAG TPA: hypothetical protein PK537_07940, partial [Candidatus Limiplasma sp.]|nr:hypothetical protein [Candidatus Limiplasma sp.]